MNGYARKVGRMAAVAIAALGASAAALGVSSSASAAPGWQWYHLDADSCYEAATLDSNGNTWVDEAWFDLDNDCRLDTHLWNSVAGENLLESLTFDMDENGRWDSWVADTNQWAGFDVVYFDQNGDGYGEGPYSMAQNSTQTLFEQINLNNGVYHNDLSRFAGQCPVARCWL